MFVFSKNCLTLPCTDSVNPSPQGKLKGSFIRLPTRSPFGGSGDGLVLFPFGGSGDRFALPMVPAGFKLIFIL